MYDKLTTAAMALQSIKQTGAKIGVVLGSALSPFLDFLEEKTVIPYSEIPYFPTSCEGGSAGNLILAKLGGVELAILQGRSHLYEGRCIHDIVFPVRTLSTLGIQTLILTNSAGGLNESFQLGDLILLSDHINLSGKNPLEGHTLAELGNEFPEMTQVYYPPFRKLFFEAAAEIGYHLKEGVYALMQGPTYETPAEVRMLKILGADLVGMSLVPESIAATHLGVKVAAISCITNITVKKIGEVTPQENLDEKMQKAMRHFSELMKRAVLKIAQSDE